MEANGHVRQLQFPAISGLRPYRCADFDIVPFPSEHPELGMKNKSKQIAVSLT
jgi:hypothetical protein